MRAMLLSPTLEGGGSEALTITYASGLQARGHEVAISYGFEDFLPRARARGVPTMRLTDRPLSARTLAHWGQRLRAGIRHFHPEVIHTQSVTCALLCMGWAPRVPLVMTVHGISSDQGLVATGPRAWARDPVSAVSEAAADGLRRVRWPLRVDLLPPGVHLDGLRAAAAEPPPIELPQGPLVCCVARQHRAKGVDVLFRSLQILVRSHPEVSLVLVGDGEQGPRNRELADGLGIADHLVFAGYQANQAPILRAADVAILPSRGEGIPVVALEALALERPLVATAVGGTPEVVRDGQTGWLVPSEDPGALAEAIGAALEDRAEAARRGSQGCRLVEERYGDAPMVDRVEAMLSEAISRRTRSAGRVPPLKPKVYYRATSLIEDARVARARRSGRRAVQPGVRLLGYHRVAEDGDVLAVAPSTFRWQIDAVLGSGAKIVRLHEAIGLLETGVEEPLVCITFDDGYRDTLEQAAPILAEFDAPGTLFLPSAILEGRADFYWYRHAAPPALSPAEVLELARGGTVDIQSHSQTHPRLPALTDAAAASEIIGSRETIERALRAQVTSFSYPAGLYGPREVGLVAEAGYLAGVTTRSGVNTRETSPWELRRTMITWADDRDRFQAKISGKLDQPSRLTAMAQRLRGARTLS